MSLAATMPRMPGPSSGARSTFAGDRPLEVAQERKAATSPRAGALRSTSPSHRRADAGPIRTARAASPPPAPLPPALPSTHQHHLPLPLPEPLPSRTSAPLPSAEHPAPRAAAATAPAAVVAPATRAARRGSVNAAGAAGGVQTESRRRLREHMRAWDPRRGSVHHSLGQDSIHRRSQN
jgi:hypothetical protein